GNAQDVGVAELLQPRLAVFRLVLVVQADDGNDAALRQLDEERVLVAAGYAPRGPYVQQPHLALHVLLREREIGLIELRELERRRRLVDERRRHLAGVQRQPDGKQHDQQDENAQRDQVPHVGRAPGTIPAAAASASRRRALR